MVRYFEGYKPYIVTKRITSQLPYERWYKCNTHGASKGNPGPSSYGFCVRNDTGDVVFVMAEEIGISTNIVAEESAIVEGLLDCVQRQLHPLIIETDSLVMKKIIEGEWEISWNIGKEVKKIKEIKKNYNVIFQHVLREGNTVADFLANLVFSFTGAIQFHSFSEMPSAGRRLINLDKSKTPNFRVRMAKRKAPD
uniref:14.7 kDa ribonuclease H-like protein n=1 Tax=Nicotiana tabacum TaxID=4097 RepID=A0A1S3YIU5_TOBAC|nr:PREDICTED: 14.7 kDa ribonuclease H-like protein [Nicotiana tabacum]